MSPASEGENSELGGHPRQMAREVSVSPRLMADEAHAQTTGEALFEGDVHFLVTAVTAEGTRSI